MKRLAVQPQFKSMILGNDQKPLRTFAPAGYQVFWNSSPRQIPVPI